MPLCTSADSLRIARADLTFKRHLKQCHHSLTCSIDLYVDNNCCIGYSRRLHSCRATRERRPRNCPKVNGSSRRGGGWVVRVFPRRNPPLQLFFDRFHKFPRGASARIYTESERLFERWWLLKIIALKRYHS